MKPITTAVFPLAGPRNSPQPQATLGAREMTLVVDKPLIQYAVEEALAAGITSMIFITGNLSAGKHRFDAAQELESAIELRGKSELMETVHNLLPKRVECIFVRQPNPGGLGEAILCARSMIGDVPFAVSLADDLIDARPGAMAQVMVQHERYHCSVVGVQRIAREESAQFCVARCHPLYGPLSQVAGFAQGPQPADAPSTLGIVGRYILTPQIFKHLESFTPDEAGVIHLVDAIAQLLHEEQVLACEVLGTRYDCRSKLGYLKATLAYGLTHPEVGSRFAAFLEERVAA
jgi:UTP--glucose-1-phosphate uridylyltransferase